MGTEKMLTENQWRQKSESQKRYKVQGQCIQTSYTYDDIKLTTSILILSVNGLNTQNKRQRLLE